MTELKIPDVGESITEVRIGRWLKKDGERVSVDEDLVEVETEKASVNLPSPAEGVLSIVLEEGEFAEVGDVIAKIDDGDEDKGDKDAKDEKETTDDEDKDEKQKKDKKGAKDKTKEKDEDKSEDEKDEKDKKEEAADEGAEEPEEKDGEDDENEDEDSGDGTRIMPAAARLLEEYDLDPGDVKASGPGGRLLKEDVQRHLAQGEAREAAKAALSDEDRTTDRPVTAEAESESRAASTARNEDVRPMSMIRRTIARRLVAAQQEAALLTTFNEIDMQPVMELRSRYKDEFQERHGVKLGFMSFFVKASVAALQRFPAVNSEIRDKDVVTKHYYDVGIAIGGGEGLVVPVIRDADRLGLAEIEETIADLGERAQNNEIEPEELQGGTFTISNGGIYGSLLSTPIVNPPQSGILGMHAIQERPVVRDGDIVVRPMMYVALTYDHRAVDGREAVTFLRTIKEIIEEPARLFLEI